MGAEDVGRSAPSASGSDSGRWTGGARRHGLPAPRFHWKDQSRHLPHRWPAFRRASAPDLRAGVQNRVDAVGIAPYGSAGGRGRHVSSDGSVAALYGDIISQSIDGIDAMTGSVQILVRTRKPTTRGWSCSFVKRSAGPGSQQSERSHDYVPI